MQRRTGQKNRMASFHELGPGRDILAWAMGTPRAPPSSFTNPGLGPRVFAIPELYAEPICGDFSGGRGERGPFPTPVKVGHSPLPKNGPKRLSPTAPPSPALSFTDFLSLRIRRRRLSRNLWQDNGRLPHQSSFAKSTKPGAARGLPIGRPSPCHKKGLAPLFLESRSGSAALTTKKGVRKGAPASAFLSVPT